MDCCGTRFARCNVRLASQCRLSTPACDFSANRMPAEGDGAMSRGRGSDSPIRKEDYTLLSGCAQFTDDIHLDRMVHGVFVRSPTAHAQIARIDTSDAMKSGALLVLTAKDLPFIDRNFIVRYWHPNIRNGAARFLATDRVR